MPANSNVVEKQWVKILTCDPRSRRVEGILKDYSVIQIAVYEVPVAFRWPKEGEWWQVVRENYDWFLRAPLQAQDTDARIEDLDPGDAQLGIPDSKLSLYGLLYLNGAPFLGHYDVTSFGAKGDGTTNDAPAVGRAFSAAISAGGGIIYFPPGTYLLGKITNIFANNIWVMGAGRGLVTLKLANGVNNHLLNVVGNNWTITDLTLDGNRLNQTTGHCLRMSGDDHSVERLIIKGACSYGIGLAESTGTSLKRGSFRDIYISDTGLDGIDMKDAAGLNEGNSFTDIVVRNWGQADADQTGIDVRGFGTSLQGIKVYDVHDDDCGIRFRESDSGVTGVGCNGSSLEGFYIYGEAGGSLGIGLSIASGNVQVANGWIDGVLQQSGGMTGVSVGGINTRITQVTATNGGIGFLLGSGANFAELHDCSGTGNNDGVRVDSNDVTIRGGRYTNNLRWGINPSTGLRLRLEPLPKFTANGSSDINSSFIIASAAALAVPSYATVWHVSGTTTITSISGDAWRDRQITLIFDGALTFTDGSNLKLNGNFVTTADDSITLVYDGTNWIETARSPN